MARKASLNGYPRAHQVIVYLTEEEEAEVRERARKARIPMSAYIRQRLFVPEEERPLRHPWVG